MSERSSIPLAIAIMGMSLAVISYGIRDEILATLVYGSGLASAALSLVDWFIRPRSRA